jgi:WD40 repeat protein
VGALVSARREHEAALASREREHLEAHAEGAVQERLALLHRARERAARPTPGWTIANRADLRRAVTPSSGGQSGPLRSALAETLAGADLLPRGTAAAGVDAHAVAFSPDGTRLAVGVAEGGGELVAVRLIDPIGGGSERLLRGPVPPAWRHQRDRRDGVRSLAFSPDGRQLAAGTRSGWVHCWDLTRRDTAPVSWPAHADAVCDLAFPPDGSALLSLGNDGLARRWRPEEGGRLPGEVSGLQGDSRLALAPDGSALALSLRAEGPYWFRPDLSPLDRPGSGAGAVHHAVHPSGLLLVSSRQRVLEFVDAASGRIICDLHPDGATEAHAEPIAAAVFSPDGRLLVTTSRTDARLRLWECASGRLVLEQPLGGGAAVPAFSPDGRTLAVAAAGRTLIFDVAADRVLTIAAMQAGRIDDLALCPESKRLVCLARQPGQAVQGLSEWHLDRLSAAPLRSRLPQEGALALALGPDSRLWLAKNAAVRAWDRELRPGATWGNQPPPGHEDARPVQALAAGRGVLLAGTDGGFLHVLAADEARVVASCRVTEAPARAVALSPDESRAAAASTTGEVVVVDVFCRVFNADGSARTGDLPIASFPTSVPKVAMAGNGQFTVAWSAAGSVLARTYTASGDPLTGPVTVFAATSKGGSTTSGGLWGVAADSNGDAVVVYATGTTSSKWGPGTPTWKVQRLTPAGSLSGGAITVATPTLLNGAGGVAMDGAGNFVVTWDDVVNSRSGNGNGPYVYAQRYDSSGHRAGGLITFPTALWPSVAMNAGGRFVVTYDGGYATPQEQKLARVFNPDGTPAGGPVAFAAGASGIFNGEPTAVAIDGAGNVMFAWTSTITPPNQGSPYYTGEVRMQRLTAAGVLEPQMIVNTTTQGAQALPGVAATGIGSFVIGWQGYGLADEDGGIFVQRYVPLPAVLGAVSMQALDSAFSSAYAPATVKMLKLGAGGDAARVTQESDQARDVVFAERMVAPDQDVVASDADIIWRVL